MTNLSSDGAVRTFMDIFSIDSGPRRHFSIDTGLVLDIFSNLWSTLPRPWHVADLLGFLYYTPFIVKSFYYFYIF